MPPTAATGRLERPPVAVRRRRPGGGGIWVILDAVSSDDASEPEGESSEPTSRWSNPLASAEERERFTELVQYHFAHGRLTAEELEERLEGVLAARTLGDLYALCRDLPFPPAVLGDHAARRVRRGKRP